MKFFFWKKVVFFMVNYQVTSEREATTLFFNRFFFMIEGISASFFGLQCLLFAVLTPVFF